MRPRELSAFFAYLIVPPGPPFPEQLHMKTLCGIVYVYAGDLEKGEQLTRPLREFGPPAFALGHPAPYPAVQSMFDPLVDPGALSLLEERLRPRSQRSSDPRARSLRAANSHTIIRRAYLPVGWSGSRRARRRDGVCVQRREVHPYDCCRQSRSRADAPVPRVGSRVLVSSSSLFSGRRLRQFSDG